MIEKKLFSSYFEMVYAGFVSFGKAPAANESNLKDADVGVFGIPWDATATLRAGARLGPRGIREQSIWFHEVWNPQETPLMGFGEPRTRNAERINLVDFGDVTLWPGDIKKTSESIRTAAAYVASQAFPLMLGGDHYVMFPTYQGICDANPDARIGIIQIDAHNDLIDSDAVYGTHWSGTPIRRSLEHSRIDPRAIAQVGLRGFIGQKERHYQVEHEVTVIDMGEFRELGPEGAAEKAITQVGEHCDLIYLTIDIDSVDPSAAPGCSTPVPGGIRGDELIALLRRLGAEQTIVALDLVEVAPTLDPTHQTTLLAAHALFGFIEEHFLLEPL